jgi:hypothetical protein
LTRPVKRKDGISPDASNFFMRLYKTMKNKGLKTKSRLGKALKT